MTRKPRSDSKLLTLPEEVQLSIYELLKSGLGYTKTKLVIAKEYNVKTSEAAISGFWEWWSRKASEERIIHAVAAANDITTAAAGNLPLINQATMAALQQSAFEAILAGGDQKMIKDFMNIVLKARALDQTDQSLSLRLREFEQKIAAVQDTLCKARKDGGMTLEAIELMEQQLGLL